MTSQKKGMQDYLLGMDYLIFDGGEKSGQFLLSKNFVFHH